MAIAKLALNWQGDPVAVRCPICAAKIWDGEDCEHVLAKYLDCAEGFYFSNQAFEAAFYAQAEEALKKLNHDEDYTVDDYLSELGEGEELDLLAKASDSPSAFCLSITTSGVSCGGPVSGTAIVCIECNPTD